jgi:hypothetical protein
LVGIVALLFPLTSPDETGAQKRNAAERALTLIADDCEAWLRSESDEPSAEFIKLVAKYARNHLTQ